MPDKTDSTKSKSTSKKSRGRPSNDWNALFNSWLDSGLSKNQFLKEHGINPHSGAAYHNTKNWTYDVTTAYRKMKDTKEYEEHSVKPKPPESAMKVDISRDVSSMWDMIRSWREGQAGNDYRIADSIRSHLKLILNSAVVRSVDDDGKESVKSRFKPHELKAISATLETVQKIQRLALGMSTENVGVEARIEPKDPIDKRTDDNCPIFEVQINKNGKFERARPAQVR